MKYGIKESPLQHRKVGHLPQKGTIPRNFDSWPISSLHISYKTKNTQRNKKPNRFSIPLLSLKSKHALWQCSLHVLRKIQLEAGSEKSENHFFRWAKDQTSNWKGTARQICLKLIKWTSLAPKKLEGLFKWKAMYVLAFHQIFATRTFQVNEGTLTTLVPAGRYQGS